MTTLYIDTQEKLLELCEHLAGCEWLALDTEFMRETTYYPKLCLLQVGTPEITACVDPLALSDLGPLLDVIYDPAIIKVMHACGQDMEIFYHLRGDLPGPAFDTQIAAPLLGYPEQAGYARLVEDILKVRLDKLHTRADWSRRPLTQAQIKYAADDVIYLCRIYQHLRKKLVERGRLEWLADEFDTLCKSATYQHPPELAWRRVKAAYKLNGKALACLQQLAAWREETAQSENRPRGRLFKDDVLIDLARQLPGNRGELVRIRGMHERVVKRHGERILELIHDGKEANSEPLPDYVKKPKLTLGQEAQVCLLNAVVHLRATEHELNPTQLASHKDLKRLVQGEDGLAVLQGWRSKLIGDELQAILRGDHVVSAVEGTVSVRVLAS